MKSLAIIPDVFLHPAMEPVLILPLRKGPTVGVLSEYIFPSVPSFSPAACVPGVKKTRLFCTDPLELQLTANWYMPPGQLRSPRYWRHVDMLGSVWVSVVVETFGTDRWCH